MLKQILAGVVVALMFVGVMGDDSTAASVRERREAEFAECFQKDNLDLVIRRCTKLIQYGRVRDHVLFSFYAARADAYEAKGDFERAMADYDKAIQFMLYYAPAYTNRGNAYLNRGHFDRAITDYDKAIEISPFLEVDAYLNRGIAYNAKGNSQKALSDFRLAANRTPPNMPGHAWMLERIAEIEEKLAAPARPSVTARPSSPGDTTDERGTNELALIGAERWVVVASRQILDEAIDIARRYTRQKSRVIRAQNGWYAVILGPYRTNDIASFRRSYNGPALPSDTLLSRGTQYVETMWPVQSGRSVKVTTRVTPPSSANVKIFARDCIVRSHPVDKRIRDCGKAITSGFMQGGDLAVLYYNRGVAFSERRSWVAAIDDYGWAIRLNPVYAVAYFKRALAYDHTGDLEKALADYKTATRMKITGRKTHARIAEIERELAPPSSPKVVAKPAPSSAPRPTEETDDRRVFSIADGAVVEVFPRNGDDREFDIIVVTGAFKHGDEKSFKRAVLTVDEPVLVSFSSPGGNLKAGMEIGRTIWTNQFMTLVKDGECASACALAWLAGRPRFATPNAQIGFHAPKRADDPDRQADSVGSAFVGGYLNELGFTAAAIAYMTESNPDDMNWLSFEKARSLGIYVETLKDELALGDLP